MAPSRSVPVVEFLSRVPDPRRQCRNPRHPCRGCWRWRFARFRPGRTVSVGSSCFAEAGSIFLASWICSAGYLPTTRLPAHYVRAGRWAGFPFFDGLHSRRRFSSYVGFGADPGPGRATTAPPSPRRRSGPAGRRARGPLRPAAEAAGELAPTLAGPVHGRVFRCSTGLSLARASPVPSGLGADPGRVALPLLRRRSGGGPVPPGGGRRAGSAGRPKRQQRARPCRWGEGQARFSPGGGHLCQRFLGASALGRTRGRVALPLRRRRRDGGPPLPSSCWAAGRVAAYCERLRTGTARALPPSAARRQSDRPRPGKRRAGGRFGRGAKAARDGARPRQITPRLGFSSRHGAHFRQRLLDPGALGRTRAGSHYRCSAVAAAEVVRSRAHRVSRVEVPAGVWPEAP